MVVSPRWPVRAGRRVRGSRREWPNSRPARRRCGGAGGGGASGGRAAQGVADLEAGEAPLRRVRREGGGRKALAATDPALIAALLALVEPTRRGGPCSPLCWTTLSTRKLAA